MRVIAEGTDHRLHKGQIALAVAIAVENMIEQHGVEVGIGIEFFIEVLVTRNTEGRGAIEVDQSWQHIDSVRGGNVQRLA